MKMTHQIITASCLLIAGCALWAWGLADYRTTNDARLKALEANSPLEELRCVRGTPITNLTVGPWWDCGAGSTAMSYHVDSLEPRVKELERTQAMLLEHFNLEIEDVPAVPATKRITKKVKFHPWYLQPQTNAPWGWFSSPTNTIIQPMWIATNLAVTASNLAYHIGVCETNQLSRGQIKAKSWWMIW